MTLQKWFIHGEKIHKADKKGNVIQSYKLKDYDDRLLKSNENVTLEDINKRGE